MLIFDKDPQKYMVVLEIKYMVKSSIIGEPRVYLVYDGGKVLYGDTYYACIMSSDLYVKEAINNLKKRLMEDGLGYNKNLSDVNYLPKNSFLSVEYRT